MLVAAPPGRDRARAPLHAPDEAALYVGSRVQPGGFLGPVADIRMAMLVAAASHHVDDDGTPKQGEYNPEHPRYESVGIMPNQYAR